MLPSVLWHQRMVALQQQYIRNQPKIPQVEAVNEEVHFLYFESISFLKLNEQLNFCPCLGLFAFQNVMKSILECCLTRMIWSIVVKVVGNYSFSMSFPTPLCNKNFATSYCVLSDFAYLRDPGFAIHCHWVAASTLWPFYELLPWPLGCLFFPAFCPQSGQCQLGVWGHIWSWLTGLIVRTPLGLTLGQSNCSGKGNPVLLSMFSMCCVRIQSNFPSFLISF